MSNKQFLDCIIKLTSKGSQTTIEDLRHLIPETPDNLEAIKHLSVQEDDNAIGVGTHSGILASSIINTLEESPIPTEVKSRYPQLSEREWQGILRYCTLVLCALERTKADVEASSIE